MEEGQGGEARILAAVAGSGARHATTTATAIRRALDALGARKIVLVTPYTQAVTDHEAEFLNDCRLRGHLRQGLRAGRQRRLLRDAAAGLARPRARGGAAGRRRLFPELRQYSVFGIIEELEAELGKPVITSNQTVIWDALARLGMERPPRLPGTIVRNRRRCGGGAGGATCVATVVIPEAAKAAVRNPWMEMDSGLRASPGPGMTRGWGSER